MATKPEPVEVHLKNAKFADIEAQAAKLRQSYEIYKSMRKVTRQPGELSMDYNVRSKGADAVSGRRVTSDQLLADTAKFRILEGIRGYVGSRFGDVASFDLAFDLSCRRVPDVILPEDIAIGQQFQQ